MTGNGFDYDVIVVGSGFGGSVAAMRAVDKGSRVGAMEAASRVVAAERASLARMRRHGKRVAPAIST